MKRLLLLLITILMGIPAAFVAMQDNSAPLGLQITGVNDTAYPTVIVYANVYDRVGQPVLGLGIDDFKVVGDLTDNMEVVKVENVTDDSLAFSVVLAIDTSGSMTGSPIENTIIAAKSFINNIGPNDPVAIVTFDNSARLVQDFTTDKDLLNQTIDTLRYGGETALYDGSLLAVTTAANSPVSRRAVIILSDGQEYRASESAREAALDEALRIGVPVYTIGEGFGFDRSFMEGLAQGTSAQFYESPNPEQLNEIYNTLASILRSQYIITLQSDLPGDGQTYDLDLEVTNTDSATATATSEFRARIYEPIVTLNLPTEAIAEATTVTPNVASDDGITSATYQINDGEVIAVEEPYAFTIDPAVLSSGENTVTFSATDTTGDTTTTTGTFLVAPKPPTVTINGLGEGNVVSTRTNVDITGTAVEGSVQGLIIKVNDAVVASAQNKASTSVTLDPETLPPGENTFTAIVRDSVGGRVEQTLTFTVPVLPPSISINGVTPGETIIENRTVDVAVSSPQTPLTQVAYKIDGVEIATQTEEPFTLELDVESIGVGSHILSVEATNEGGESASADVAFVIAAPTATPTATSTSTNTPVPPTATNTDVPPTNTDVPPTATNTEAPATATNTSAPATNTSLPATVDTSATSAAQANVSTNEASTAVAAAATDTNVPVTNTTAPTDTNVPATATSTNTNVPPTATSTNTAEPTDTNVPPTTTSTATTEATEEVTAEVTEAATEESTAEATEAATEESTAEATEATTEEATAEVTEAATAEVTADSTSVAAAATNTTEATTTEEATEAATNQAPGAPTFTPIPLTAESQSSAGQTQSPLLIGAVCLLGLLLLAVVYWFAARRNKR